jgi:tRNA dimethylallyltransferase
MVSYRCSVAPSAVPRVIAVVGPTAAGKSALSLALAHELGGEVINADSMQLYRGMDIGTAKLATPQRQGVPHHVLDIWDVTVTASVAEYQRLARRAVADVAARGRVPVLVGGSGLYVRAVLEEFAFPGTDPAIRSRLEAELATVGAASLHARRIVRALEVVEMTGGPFTAALPGPTPAYPSVQIGVDRDTDDLDRRIAERVEHMWASGLLDEVRRLERAGLRAGRTAGRALGYQQALAEMDGVLTDAQARAATTRATRRFVRRQRSWFRRDPRIVWLDGASPALVADAVKAAR